PPPAARSRAAAGGPGSRGGPVRPLPRRPATGTRPAAAPPPPPPAPGQPPERVQQQQRQPHAGPRAALRLGTGHRPRLGQPPTVDNHGVHLDIDNLFVYYKKDNQVVVLSDEETHDHAPRPHPSHRRRQR